MFQCMYNTCFNVCIVHVSMHIYPIYMHAKWHVWMQVQHSAHAFVYMSHMHWNISFERIITLDFMEFSLICYRNFVTTTLV